MTFNTQVGKKGVAIILAAGRSRRFGDEDKRLCCLPDGNRMLSTVYRKACKAFEQVLVVLRENEMPSHVDLPEDCAFISAIDSDKGMGESLASAFIELCQGSHYRELEFAAVLLADMPFIEIGTLHKLRKEASQHNIVRPLYEEQAGHPVLIGKIFWSQLRVLTGDRGAKKVIDSHLESLLEVNVSDGGVIHDVDTKEALTLFIR